MSAQWQCPSELESNCVSAPSRSSDQGTKRFHFKTKDKTITFVRNTITSVSISSAARWPFNGIHPPRPAKAKAKMSGWKRAISTLLHLQGSIMNPAGQSCTARVGMPSPPLIKLRCSRFEGSQSSARVALWRSSSAELSPAWSSSVT